LVFYAHVDAGLMVDVDLSILGRDEERFLEYEEQIQLEYAWVPKTVFVAKRLEVLGGFVARERIFSTEYFHARYERQARWNLAASINRLRPLPV
jgi:predicted metal-dependent HD superfamily phosphohydrolase